MLILSCSKRKDQESQVESQNGGNWPSGAMRLTYFDIFSPSMFSTYTHVRRLEVYMGGSIIIRNASI